MNVDLTIVSLEELVKEVEHRKKKLIPEIIDRINKDIKYLMDLGVDIVDAGDCDYKLSEITIENDGTVEYNSIYK